MKRTGSKAWLVATCLAGAMGTHGYADAAPRGASVEAATKKQKADAKKKYDEGKQAFDEKRFDVALERFRESYEALASPNSHLMIARALAELGRKGEAYEEYRSVVEEATEANDPEKYGKTLESAESESAALRGGLALVTIKLDATVTANGRDLRPEQLGKPIAIQPGSAELVLKSPSGTLVTQRVDAPAGGEVAVSLTPPFPSGPPPPAPTCPPPPAPPPPAPSGINQRTLALVSGGIGLVGLGAFTAFGLLNNAQYGDLEQSCSPNGVCPASAASDAETGRTYQTLANVGLVVGMVGVGAGVALWLTSPSSQSQTVGFRSTPSGRRRAAGPHPSPSGKGRTGAHPATALRLIVGSSGVSLKGGF
jgi:hypothetical protein